MSFYTYDSGQLTSVVAGASVSSITDGVDTWQISSTGEGYIGGAVAHDAVDSGNPIKIGAKAYVSATAASVSVGDRTDLKADINGRLFTTDDQALVKLTAIAANTNLTVVDQIDTTPLLATASSNIPSLATTPLILVASLAAAVKKIKVVEDIGQFMGLYSANEPANTHASLLCVLPLGGGEVDIALAAGSAVYIRNMKAATISTATFIAINFIG